jgi:serine/threonine-protein kinase
MPVRLTVVAGPHSGQEFPFADRDTFLVGRAPGCHLQLAYDDPYSSLRHFLVEANGARCRVIDLNSRTGIKVNGQRVESAELTDGDEVRAGQTVFRVSVGPPADGPPPAHRAEPADRARALPGIPGYVLDREIGRGGLGVVYRARRVADGTRVAIKVFRPIVGVGEGNVQRFLGLARALRHLGHPNVVRVLDSGSAGPLLLYVAMKYVAGSDAGRVVRERGPLPVRPAVLLTAQALAGLAYLNARGFVHRDVKPSNLLIGKSGDRKVVKVADCGLARACEDSRLGGLALAGDVGGTLGLVAPEQVTHPRAAGPAADQYAAAATLYYLLTARPPHDLPNEPDRALATILSTDPVRIRERRPDVPEPVAGVIGRALAADPTARYPDVDAFRAALLESV